MNQKKDTEISPTKQNVSAFQYLVKRARTEKVQRELGGNANTFEGFKDIMDKYLLSVKARSQGRIWKSLGRILSWTQWYALACMWT